MKRDIGEEVKLILLYGKHQFIPLTGSKESLGGLRCSQIVVSHSDRPPFRWLGCHLPYDHPIHSGPYTIPLGADDTGMS